MSNSSSVILNQAVSLPLGSLCILGINHLSDVLSANISPPLPVSSFTKFILARNRSEIHIHSRSFKSS